MGRRRNRRKKTVCFNCDRKLKADDNFCFNCGQENHNKKAPIKLLIGDFAGDYLTIDSKFLMSLKELFFKPGVMALAFTSGKRQQYIKPIRLYLFVSFIFFLCFNLTAINNSIIIPTTSSDGENVSLSFGNSTDVSDEISDIEKTRDSLKTIVYSNTASVLQKEKADEALKSVNSQSSSISQKIMDMIPYVGFLMVPMMAIVLMLFFRRQKRFFVEHFIFSIHVHTFAFALFSGVLGIIYYLPNLKYVVVSALLILVFHTAIAMKKMYKTSWGYLAVVSVFGMLSYYLLFMIVLILFFVGISAIGFLG